MPLAAIVPLLTFLFLSYHKQHLELLAVSFTIYFILIFPNDMLLLLYFLIFNFSHYLLMSFIHMDSLHTCTLPLISSRIFLCHVWITSCLVFIVLWLFTHDSELSHVVNYDCFVFPVQLSCFLWAHHFFFLLNFITISSFTKLAERVCFLRFVVSVSLNCLSLFLVCLVWVSWI